MSYKDVLIYDHAGRFRRKEIKGFYSLALIVLWISVILDFAIDWATARAGFVVNNNSPIAIFIKLSSGLPSAWWSVPSIAATLISDAILVRITLYQ